MKKPDNHRLIVNALLDSYEHSEYLLKKLLKPYTDEEEDRHFTLEEQVDHNFIKHQICALKNFSVYWEEVLEFEEH